MRSKEAACGPMPEYSRPRHRHAKLRPSVSPPTQELEEKFIEDLGLTDADLPERYLATKRLAEGDEPALMA